MFFLNARADDRNIQWGRDAEHDEPCLGRIALEDQITICINTSYMT